MTIVLSLGGNKGVISEHECTNLFQISNLVPHLESDIAHTAVEL